MSDIEQEGHGVLQEQFQEEIAQEVAIAERAEHLVETVSVMDTVRLQLSSARTITASTTSTASNTTTQDNVMSQSSIEAEKEEEEGPSGLVREDSSASTSEPSQVFMSSSSSLDSHSYAHSLSERFSSPQLSLSNSSNDISYFPLSSSAHSRTTPHGTYTTVEVNPLSASISARPTPHGTYNTVEINPFAVEFQEGLCLHRPPSASRRTVGHALDSDSHGSLSRHISEVHPSPSPLRAGSNQGAGTIPSKAFKDPKFLEYISHLDHPPVLSDYITYRVGFIGDQIEQKYKPQLNMALDEVFYEVLKKSLSWQTFRDVSSKLLVLGGIQDGVMLIPCFARQVVHFVPDLRDTVGRYTERVMDTFASDTILGMGGWVSSFSRFHENECVNCCQVHTI